MIQEPLPTLRQLSFLTAIADELHFGRAAEKCGITQSALSNGLKELEDILQVRLVERTRRKVLMTPLGLEIVERARRLIADATAIGELAASKAAPMTETVRLGAIPTVGPFVLPHLLPRLKTEYPDLKLYLREDLTQKLVDRLLAGQLDLVLIALPFEIGDLSVMSLFEDGYDLATPKDHPLAKKALLSGRDLEGHPLLLLETGHCLQRHALSAFPNAVLGQDQSFEATSLSTLLAMVEEGLGMTLVPRLATVSGLVAGREVALTPLKGACPREVVLAWRPSSARADDYRRLGAVIRDTVAAMLGNEDR